MRLRRFEAATVPEALAQVRADLGPEAVILHARHAERARTHGSQQGWVEVTAAVDEEPRPRSREPRGSLRDERADRGVWREDRCDQGTPGPARGGGAESPAPPVLHPADSPSARWDEPGRIEEMYQMLLDLREVAAPAPRLPAALRSLYAELCRRELPAALARRLLRDLPVDPRAGRAAFQAALGRAFRVRGPVVAKHKQRVVAFVGPTGVGKTTTIAKLAGQSRQAGRLKVALVSLDTYRIGAIAQMQIYADLLRAPLHVVRSPSEFASALLAEREADLVLLDSMGRSPRHREGIAWLRPFLEGIPNLEVHLVVSATTKGSDLEEILRRFRPLRYQHVVITKLDEANSPGPLLGLALQRDLSISYLATGQEVPDDLEPATPQRLGTFLLPSEARETSRVPTRA